jgi:hypothetical protein
MESGLLRQGYPGISQSTPFSPPSDPAQRLLQGPPAKSKLLAAPLPGAPGGGYR